MEAYHLQLFRRNACTVSSLVLKIMDLRLAGSQMCEHWNQNLLCIMLLFLPFFSILGHISDTNITQRLPRWPQTIPSGQLFGAWPWRTDGMKGSSLIPWAGQDSASDVSAYGQQKVFFVSCFLMCAYNQTEHVKREKRQEPTHCVLWRINFFFLMRVDEREIDS